MNSHETQVDKYFADHGVSVNDTLLRHLNAIRSADAARKRRTLRIKWAMAGCWLCAVIFYATTWLAQGGTANLLPSYKRDMGYHATKQLAEVNGQSGLNGLLIVAIIASAIGTILVLMLTLGHLRKVWHLHRLSATLSSHCDQKPSRA